MILLPVQPGIPVVQFLTRSKIHINSACGGRGNCGKCLIRVVEGDAPISTMDRMQLTREQLDAGIRMACQLMPKTEIRIEAL